MSNHGSLPAGGGRASYNGGTDQPRSNDANERRTYLVQQRLINTQNIQSNIPWGDDIIDDKEDDSIRIYYHNVNGIYTNNDSAKASEIAMALAHKHVDIMGFSETNADWNQSKIKKRVQDAFRLQFKNTHMTTSTSDFTFLDLQHQQQAYKPGGTATIVTGKFVGRIHDEKVTDPLGNYSLITLKGRHNSAISIITAYRVVQTEATNAGTRTAYQQQRNVMRMQNISNPDPRNQAISDLRTLIQNLQHKGHEILLMIDANESLHQRNSKIEKLRNDTNLVDLHTFKHGIDGQPETYIRNRNSKRIDYMLGSPNVAKALRRAGIEPYGEGYTSDHRGLFIDLNINELLSGHIAELDTPNGRGINSCTPKSVQVYKEHVLQYFDDHNLEQRLDSVIAFINSDDNDDEASKLEATNRLNAIDRDVTRALLSAENHVRRRDPVAFSPDLEAARTIQRFWRLWLTELTTKRDMSFQRNSIEAKQQQTIHAGRPSSTLVQEKLKEASKVVWATVKSAKELRQKFLETKAESEANAATNKEAAIRKIIAAEKTKQDWQTLRTCYKNRPTKGMSHVIAPSTDPAECARQYHNPNPDPSQWKSIYDIETMEKILQARNQTHFGQAKGTPFTTPPLSTMFGWCGTTTEATDLLNGTLEPSTLEGISNATQEILQALSEPIKGIQEIRPHITIDDLKNGFKRWRESTSTSPSGRHLGHYRSIIAYTHLEKTEDDDDKLPPSTRILGVIAKVTDLAIQHGIILDRWLNITNVMIEKIPGNPLYHKLRVIHLFEADMNLALGILWSQRIMKQAERKRALGEQQFGSRKGKSAEDVVLLKQLTYELMNITKTDGGTFDNDAKACYDRIIINMMSICSQRLGMPITCAKLHAEILQKAKYYLKTTLGISEASYSNSESHPLYGPGQGGTTSAFAWAIIVAVLLAIMKRRTGVQFSDPKSKTLTQRVMDAFVDDTTAWVNFFLKSLENRERNLINDIVTELTATAQQWEELLYASGGALELSKCFYYLIHWKFDKNGNAKIDDSDLQPIRIRNSTNGQIVDIKQLKCNEAHRTLGVKISPSCSMKEELQRLRAISQKFTAQTTAATLTRSQARKAYQSIYLGRIQYGITASTLKKQDYHDIQSPAIRALLPKLGYNRNTPTPVVYGPIDQGGMGIQDLYALQGAKKTMTVIENSRSNTSVGKMINITLNWTQQQMGVSFDILKEPGKRVPPSAGDQWFRGVREFLQHSECQLDIASTRLPQPRRLGDTTIIDMAIAKDFNDNELHSIQKVRFFLQAEFISDLCNASGTKLLENVHQRKPTTISYPTAKFPRQTNPGQRDWSTFSRLLNTITITEKSAELEEKLGRWLPTWPDNRQWKAVYSLSQQYYWIHDNNKWTCYTGYTNKRTYILLDPASAIQDDSEPEDPVPVDIIATDSNHRPTKVSPPAQLQNDPQPKPQPSGNLREYIQSLPPWERQLLQNIECLEMGNETLLEAIRQGKTILVGHNGAHENEKGTYGWVIKAFDRTLWKGRGVAPGQPMSSFRAESYGHLAVLNFIYRTWTFYEASFDRNTTITIACANKSLINRKARFLGRIVNRARDYSQPDHDVILTIERILRDLPTHRKITKHVTCNLERPTDRQELPPETKIVYEAADLAKAQIDLLGTYHNPTPLTPLPDCPAYLIHKRSYITSGENTILRSSYSRKRLQSYTQQRKKWDKPTLQKVDFNALQAARNTQRTHRFSTRFMHDLLPTNDRMLKFGQATSNECPLCRQQETQDHIFRCPTRKQRSEATLERLNTHLDESGTDPAVKLQVTECMRSWLTGLQNTNLQCYQTEIGTRFLIRGFVGKDWTIKQDRYYRDTHQPYDRKLTGAKWTRNLIIFMWKEASELWQLRNESIHDPDLNLQRSELEQQVRNFYNQQDQVLAQDRGIFDLSLQDRLRHHSQQLLDFVQLQGRTITHSIRQHALQAAANVRRMTEYFQPR